MFAGHDSHGLAPELDFVQVVHGQEGLVRLSHLDQGSVFFVEEDLDAVDVAVDAKEGEEVVALGRGLVQIRDQKDAPGAQRAGVNLSSCKTK